MPPSKHSNVCLPRRSARAHFPSIPSMMREVLHRLGNLDVECEIRLDQVERNTADQELKAHIKDRIRAAHRDRREHYVELLATLRQRQQRLSFDA